MLWWEETYFSLSSFSTPRKWDEDGEEGVGGREKAYVLMIVPWLDRSSQGQAHSAKIKGEKRNASFWLWTQLLLCLHTICSPYETPLYWAVQWPWEITFIWKPGWVTGRQCNSSSLQSSWPGLSNLHSDAYATLLPKNTDGCNISKSKATALTPFQCTQTEGEVTVGGSRWSDFERKAHSECSRD